MAESNEKGENLRAFRKLPLGEKIGGTSVQIGKHRHHETILESLDNLKDLKIKNGLEDSFRLPAVSCQVPC